MRHIAQRLLLVGMMGAGLAACGSSGNNGGTTPPPVIVPVATPQENQFGAGFATDFRASPASNPVNPDDGNIVPVSLTTNSVPLNC